MLHNKIEPQLSLQFTNNIDIGLDIFADPKAGIGRYRSPKATADGWTNGQFVYDGSHPEEM